MVDPKHPTLALLLLLATVHSAGYTQESGKTPTSQAGSFDVHAAQRFADLALACVHKEYPNKLTHSLNSDADVAPPHKLTPAFYGCYDWHSSVHGHWLLARLARTSPGTPLAAQAQEALRQSLTVDNLVAEMTYLNATGRASFERPYGLAWLLQLGVELRDWAADNPRNVIVQAFYVNMLPLESSAVERLKTWLPKLSHAVRSGEHSQTAFAMGLMIDYARRVGDADFEKLLLGKARDFYLGDRNCPLAYEPSGEDFLSPCLAEADVMRRVLAPKEFDGWLQTFLPQIPHSESGAWLQPEKSTDPSDPKLAHIDGLNLSRAWMLEGMASGLPRNDPRIGSLKKCADAHRAAGLAAVTGEHYEGGHWLGSFATYLTTRRGITKTD